MTDIQPDELQPTLSASDAAGRLATALGGSKARWAVWLANDRKPNRVKPALPVVRDAGRPRYLPGDVAILIKQTLAKQELQASKATQPAHRKFSPSIHAVYTEGSETNPFVMLVMVPPLQTFALTADEARNVAFRLIKAADEVSATSTLQHRS